MTDEFLTTEATRPSTVDLLEQLAKDRGKRRNPNQQPTNARATKNRLSMDKETGQLYGGPGSRPRTTSSTSRPLQTDSKSEEELRKAIERKRKRAKELESRISTEANEAMAEFLYSMMQVPKEFIWKNPPPEKVIDNNYTPWMNRIAISPWTAKIWGMTLAEVENSSAGAKIAMTAMQDSPLRLMLLVGASVVMAGKQAKAIIDLRTEIQPYLEAYQRAKQEQQEKMKAEANS